MNTNIDPDTVFVLLKTGGANSTNRIQIRDVFGSMITELAENESLPVALAGNERLEQEIDELEAGELCIIETDHE